MSIKFGREICGDLSSAQTREWLVTNGIGGYAAGTVAGLLSRRYHGLLVAALQPPLGRTLLLAKLDEVAVYDALTYNLDTNRWADGSIAPHGYRQIESFTLEGTIPTWRFACADALYDATADDDLLAELFPVLADMIDWHCRGTRYNIHLDARDGLLYAGASGVQLTWMDAKVDDWVVTPRIGKPIEINALWYTALRLPPVGYANDGQVCASAWQTISRI